ncbi:hypothetical protein IJ182_02425 [bacterium]|nr:hypothetical protein [bacterium]
MIETAKTVSLYGIIHALIDATCIMVLYSCITYNDLEYSFALIVFYNIIAFGMQSIIGDIFDRIKKPKLSAIIGCILTALSAVLWKNPIITVLCASFGNAFFHVGGGIICLKLGKQNSTIPGMYVAPGALGLFLGMLAAKNSWCSPLVFSIVLFFASAIIYINKYNICEIQKIKTLQYNKFILILTFLLGAIAIRSFVGLSISLPWKENILFVTLLTLAVVAGKFFGGIIADKFGWIKVTVIALLISSPLIAFGINSPILYIIGIFFFNFTMPVTLTAIANILPDREGYAFGLTTLALILGALPTFYSIKTGVGNEIIILITVLISAILIYFGLREYKKVD